MMRYLPGPIHLQKVKKKHNVQDMNPKSKNKKKLDTVGPRPPVRSSGWSGGRSPQGRKKRGLSNFYGLIVIENPVVFKTTLGFARSKTSRTVATLTVSFKEEMKIGSGLSPLAISASTIASMGCNPPD